MKGQYVGCVTGFVDGMGQIFVPHQAVQAQPTPYLERLVAVKLILVEDSVNPINPPSEPIMSPDFYPHPQPVACTPQPSEWSRPITWEMVNHPNKAGWVSVQFDALGSPNFGLNLSVYDNIHKFFDELYNQAQYLFPFEIDKQPNSVRIRYLPRESYAIPIDMPVEMCPRNVIVNPHLVTERETFTYDKRGDFYVNEPSNIGNMGETSICLADAFDEAPVVVSCITRDYSIPMPM